MSVALDAALQRHRFRVFGIEIDAKQSDHAECRAELYRAYFAASIEVARQSGFEATTDFPTPRRWSSTGARKYSLKKMVWPQGQLEEYLR